jgi:hypothetical protein
MAPPNMMNGLRSSASRAFNSCISDWFTAITLIDLVAAGLGGGIRNGESLDGRAITITFY